jgi:hypothetical protein
MVAVSKDGDPLPWYSYPCIDFLKSVPFGDKTVLELGGGQSTLWWGEHAKHVVAFEDSEKWHSRLIAKAPDNVELFLVSQENSTKCLEGVNQILRSKRYLRFDVVIIDGFYRYEMIDLACQVVSEDGAIICDDSDRFRIYDGFKERDFSRVDFFGLAPCLGLPRCTSIFFKKDSFLFDPRRPIPDFSLGYPTFLGK